MNTIIDELLESVRLQIGDYEIMDELSDKLNSKKYREVFLIFHNIKKSGRWVLSDRDEKNLENFWWNYAN